MDGVCGWVAIPGGTATFSAGVFTAHFYAFVRFLVAVDFESAFNPICL